MAETSSPADRGGRWPSGRVVTCILGFAIVMAILRWRTITGDHAWDNILTAMLGFAIFATLFGWFAFCSSYSRPLRFAVSVVILTTLFVLSAVLRVEQMSGELIPTFRPRWLKRSDELLARPAAAARSSADLHTTTENDYSQFLGSERNLRVDQVQLARDWIASPPQLLWKQPIGAGWSAFSVVNGYAVTMEQRGPEELVTCYEAATGKLIWSHAIRNRHETVLGGIGPRSTPTISGGRVYSLGAAGDLCCLDGATGSVVWHENLLRRYRVTNDASAVAWGRSASPLVVDDLVIVPAGGPASGRKVSLAAFHKDSGSLAWEAGDRQVGYSSPVLTTLAGVRQVVSVNEDNVSGHDPATGRILWEAAWPGISTQDANASQPVPVGGDRLLLSKGYTGGAKLLHLAKSDADQWLVRDLWHQPLLLRTKFTNAVIYRNHAYALSDGILECVDLENGARKWKKGRYGHGQILGVGDLILVVSEAGYVILVEAAPAGLRELAGFQAIEGRTWNNLCLTGNRLLVRNAEQAACYELPLAADSR